MIKLLTINSEAKSATRMGLPLTVRGFGEKTEAFNNDIVIRWGNSQAHMGKIGYEKEFAQVINPARAIRTNCHKYNSSVKLESVVLVPKLFKEKVPAGVVAVVRNIEHAAGSDFAVEKGEYELRDGQYASEFIKTNTEVRVWFCGNATLAAKRIPLRDTEETEHPCRSGWNYHFCYKQVPQILHESTLAAAKAIGLEFGAADILVKNGHYYFLELNSAPTIDKMRLEKFFKVNLIKLMKKKFGSDFDRLAEADKLKAQCFNFFDKKLD